MNIGMTAEDTSIVLDRLWVGNCARVTLCLGMINHDRKDAAIMSELTYYSYTIGERFDGALDL